MYPIRKPSQHNSGVRPRLTFGAYKGCELSEVPTAYLEWCLSNFAELWDWLKVEIQRELTRRDTQARRHGVDCRRN